MSKARPIHPATLNEEELLKQCRSAKSRTGGPGGQHRNKVETAIELVHEPTGISAKASERRSVRENMPVAIKRLRYALAVGYRVGVPIGDVRSAMWRERVRNGKIVCSTRHADHPAMIAEALDYLEASGWDHKRAGIRLECTPTQLVRLLKDHPAAWALFVRERSAMGFPTLH